MKTVNTKTGEDVSGAFLKLMKKEITNKEFEELTGLEPADNNPSRENWLQRNKRKDLENLSKITIKN